MRYSQSEKMEVIRTVESSELGVRQTLREFQICRSTFYDWYRRYLDGGYDGLSDKRPNPKKFWNKIPDPIKEQVVDIALDQTEKSPRELACYITDTQGYFISESSVYRILKSHDLITSPNYIVMSADDNGDCTINIFDITDLISYLYIDGPEPVCGCVEGCPAPKSYAHDLVSGSRLTSGSIYATVENGKTIIILHNTADIMAMEVELKSVDGFRVELRSQVEGYKIYGQLNNGLYKGALFDVSGQNTIESGEHVIIEIDGKVEIESVIAADIYSQPVYFEINNSGKELGNDLLPAEFSLEQNRPNPFNPITNINFSLPMASNVELVVYNVTGQRVKILADRYYDAGMHTIEWDAGNVASGIYFYRIKAGEFVESRKMILLK